MYLPQRPRIWETLRTTNLLEISSGHRCTCHHRCGLIRGEMSGKVLVSRHCSWETCGSCFPPMEAWLMVT